MFRRVAAVSRVSAAAVAPRGLPLTGTLRHSSGGDTGAAGEVAALREHHARVLVPLLEERRAELQRLSALRDACEAEAAAHAQRGMVAIGAAFFLQSAVLFDWTYVHFDWNLVEPITYLLGYTMTWVAIAWYGNLQRDFSLDSLRAFLRGRRLQRLCAARGLDLVRLRELEADVAALERRCRALRDL